MEARKIIITGGATRIGAAIARKLSGFNKEILIHFNKSKSKAEKLKKELEVAGTKVYLVKGDLSKENDVNKIVKHAKLKLKYFDCLINNASLFENDKIENFTTDSWGKHLRTNLRTPALLSKEFAKNIRGKNNNIINIIDQRVFKLTPYFFSYTISKTGLYTLTLSYSLFVIPGPSSSIIINKFVFFLLRLNSTLVAYFKALSIRLLRHLLIKFFLPLI